MGKDWTTEHIRYVSVWREFSLFVILSDLVCVPGLFSARVSVTIELLHVSLIMTVSIRGYLEIF